MTPDEFSKSLADEGFVILRDVMSPAALGAVSSALERVVSDLAADSRAAIRSLGGIGKVERYPELLSFVLGSESVSLVEGLLREQLTYHLGVVFLKPKRHPIATFWHQDYITWGDPRARLHAPSYLQIRWYLDPVGAESGGMRIIPRSHRTCHELHHQWREGVSEFNGDVRAFTNALRTGDSRYAWAYEAADGAIDIPMRPGDLAVLDCRLLHGASANVLLDERRLMTGFYFCNFGALTSAVRQGVSREIGLQRTAENAEVFDRFSYRLPPAVDDGPAAGKPFREEFPHDLDGVFTQLLSAAGSAERRFRD